MRTAVRELWNVFLPRLPCTDGFLLHRACQAERLSAYAEGSIKAIVVTDGERILGLGGKPLPFAHCLPGSGAAGRVLVSFVSAVGARHHFPYV